MSGGYVECGDGVDDDVGRRGDDGEQPPSAHVDAGYVGLGEGNGSESVGADVDGADVGALVNALDGWSVKSERGVVIGPTADDENADADGGFENGERESIPAALEIYLCPLGQHVPFPSHDP